MEFYLHAFDLQLVFRPRLALFWVCSTEGCSGFRLRHTTEKYRCTLLGISTPNCPVAHALT
jgi:hypothetical protein